MEEIRIKQNNLVKLKCTSSTTLGSQTVLSSMLGPDGTVYPIEVEIIDQTHFNLVLDTSNFEVGRYQLDFKIGSVSSPTIQVVVVKVIT